MGAGAQFGAGTKTGGENGNGCQFVGRAGGVYVVKMDGRVGAGG